MWKFKFIVVLFFISATLEAKQKNNFQFCPALTTGIYKCEVVLRDLDNKKIRSNKILDIASNATRLLSAGAKKPLDVNIYDLELWDNLESFKYGQIENQSIVSSEIDLEDPAIPYELGKMAFTSDGDPYYSLDIFSTEGWSLEQEILCTRSSITSRRIEKSSSQPLISADIDEVDIEESQMVIKFLKQYEISIYVEFTKTNEEVKNISLNCRL
ncbi:MAG: hypothetical protein QE271_14875 [Bacteriovoracaceae bacterium]|nr:hypothetical protein [Bacteriovoracaceae bacterium]